MGFDIQNETIKKAESFCKENNLFHKDDGIVVGVSGGADSVFLLSFFSLIQKKWNLRLHVVHVNHGIRGEDAAKDQEYVRNLTKTMGISCTEYETEVKSLAEQWKMTEEEAGRTYRYQCFEEIRKQYGFQRIAVAHHADDQAETVLFQLFRGSGLRGLGGMYPKKGFVIRPLLCLHKKEILETLDEEGIKYCKDLTNEENAYSRNQIRNVLLPWVEKSLQPKAQAHIAESAGHLREVMSYMDEQTGNIYYKIVKEGENERVVRESDFVKCHPAIQRELIIKMIESLAGKKKDITGRHIEAIRNICLGGTGKCLDLPYEVLARKDYGSLVLQKKQEKKKNQTFQEVFLPGRSYQIPFTDGKVMCFTAEKQYVDRFMKDRIKKYCTKCFDYDKIDSIVLFRYPMAGDYLWLDVSGRKKKLGRIFIDDKIPVERRKRMVVLAEGSHILWIPELGRSSAFYYLSEKSREMIYIQYNTGEGWNDERSYT